MACFGIRCGFPQIKHARTMATAEPACARPQRIVFWRLRKPKTHMNITAVTPAQMVHAVEFSGIGKRRCQRCARADNSETAKLWLGVRACLQPLIALGRSNLRSPTTREARRKTGFSHFCQFRRAPVRPAKPGSSLGSTRPGCGRVEPSGANTLCRGDRLRACLGPRTLSTADNHSPVRRSVLGMRRLR